ncbi:MAG TPA: universal stress protein [Chloroflexota bacterium]
MWKILVPLDGSEARERAIPWADNLASALNAELTLMRVLPDGASDETALRDLKRVRQGMRRPAAVSIQIVYGELAETVGERARDGYDAVVIGSRIEHGRARTDQESTLAEVIQRAGVPVLTLDPATAHRGPRLPRRIVVPLDGSEAAAGVLPFVAAWARPLHCMVMLVGVHAPESEHGSTFRDMGGYLHHAGAELTKQGIPTRTVVRVGKPGPAILEFARAASADIIAMSLGTQRAAHLRLGGVAEYVLANAPVPVLAIYPLAAGPIEQTSLASVA